MSSLTVSTTEQFDADLVTTAHPARSAGILSRLRDANRAQKFLWLLLLIFLVKGVVIALVFEPYSGHDEIAHYAYLKVLAEEGRVPLIPDLEVWRENYEQYGDAAEWDRLPEDLYMYAHQRGGETSYTTEDWFGGQQSPVWAINFGVPKWPSGWVYTGNHPPLFYMALVPVYHLVKDIDIQQQIYFFRMAAIPFGMVTVVLAYLTVRAIFPRDTFLAMTVPAFVAFQPQISYEASMLNNDIAAIMFTSAVIWALAAGLRNRFPLWSCTLVGLFFGLAVLSKSTAVTTGLLIAIAMVFGLGWRNIRQWLPKGIVVGSIGGFLVLPWLLYMMSTYGDPTALRRVAQLQEWWDPVGLNGRSIMDMLTDKWFHWERWKETWGAFGWRRIQLDMEGDATLLRSIYWLVLFGFVGLAAWALKFLRTQREMITREEAGEDAAMVRQQLDETLAIVPWQVTAVLTMCIACVIGYYSILQFGTSFALTQARYYFPMIVPGAVLLMLGLRSWFPHRALPYVGAAVFIGLVLMNLVIYTGYVIPFWEGRGLESFPQ